MTFPALLVVAAAAAAACGPLPSLAVPEAPQRERLAALAGPVEILPRSTVLSLATESVVWRGLRVAEPERCGPYLRSHYTVPGAWPVPRLSLAPDRFSDVVSCQPFRSPADVALDRVVLPEVAHDAGLCARSEVERLAFAADPDNWFYGDLEVLRLGRRGRGPAGWLPTRNACWYAQTQLHLRQRYDLTIPPEDAAALDFVLSRCGARVRPPACGAPQMFPVAESGFTAPR